MSSIDDWAAKAAREIRDTYRSKYHYTIDETDHIAAIIATFAEPLLALLQRSRRSHLHLEDDTWYCCGKCTHPCDSDDPEHEHDGSCYVSSHANVPKRVSGVCDCGADAWNEQLDRALSGEDVGKRPE